MKYIFIAGAPGSKWSSVAKNIYFSKDIDRSDSSSHREYTDSSHSQTPAVHLGSYFDPGMEFGQYFDRLSDFGKEINEKEFDRPFSGNGVRIIKSHVFSLHIDYLKATWPELPVVLVERSDDACLGWWVKSGGFDITYPNYKPYYKDLSLMAKRIAEQNAGIRHSLARYKGQTINSSKALAAWLKIAPPADEYFQNYAAADIRVTVI